MWLTSYRVCACKKSASKARQGDELVQQSSFITTVASCIRYKHVLATCLQSLCYICVCHKLKFDCASLTVMSGESSNNQKKKQQQKRHKTADEQLKGGKVWLTPSSTWPPLHVHRKILTRKKVHKLLKGLITRHEATVRDCNAKHLNEIKLTTLKKRTSTLPHFYFSF